MLLNRGQRIPPLHRLQLARHREDGHAGLHRAVLQHGVLAVATSSSLLANNEVDADNEVPVGDVAEQVRLDVAISASTG